MAITVRPAEAHGALPMLLPRVLDRVVLRRLRTSDLVEFQAYRHDRGLGLYQGREPQSDAQALVFLQDVQSSPLLQPGQWSQIAIADPADDRLMGDIGLFIAEAQDQAEIGFTLARRFHGRGLATAAVRGAMDLVFAHTPVARIVGVTDARNLPSIRLLERAGMARVATADAVFRGEACTEHTYALARGSAHDPGAA